MTIEDIEATKAPLMDHLIELRTRLIRALVAFGLACVFCFFFAKQIYNILIWPFVWVAGPEVVSESLPLRSIWSFCRLGW